MNKKTSFLQVHYESYYLATKSIWLLLHLTWMWARKCYFPSIAYTLLKSEWRHTSWSRGPFVMDPMNVGSSHQFHSQFHSRRAQSSPNSENIQHWCTCAVVTREPWNHDNGGEWRLGFNSVLQTHSFLARLWYGNPSRFPSISRSVTYFSLFRELSLLEWKCVCKWDYIL